MGKGTEDYYDILLPARVEIVPDYQHLTDRDYRPGYPGKPTHPYEHFEVVVPNNTATTQALWTTTATGRFFPHQIFLSSNVPGVRILTEILQDASLLGVVWWKDSIEINCVKTESLSVKAGQALNLRFYHIGGLTVDVGVLVKGGRYSSDYWGG